MFSLFFSLLQLKAFLAAPVTSTEQHTKELGSVSGNKINKELSSVSGNKIKKPSKAKNSPTRAERENKERERNVAVLELLETENTLLNEFLTSRRKYYLACKNLDELYIKNPELIHVKNYLAGVVQSDFCNYKACYGFPNNQHNDKTINYTYNNDSNI